MEKRAGKKYYLVYCRKSSESEDRQMESIPAQISELKSLAAKKKIPIFKIYKEAQSAKKPGRPVFNEMVQMIDGQDDIKGVLCWKLNRLFRNPEDEGKIRQRLSDGKIGEIVTPNKTYLEADSDFVMAVEGAQAQRFIRDLREDTKRGIDRKLEKGHAPIFAPVGYKNNTHKKQGKKDISPHPDYFSPVRKLFELAMTGNLSMEELSKRSRKMGIKNNREKHIGRSQMADILRNPFYAGKFLYAGKIYQGKHTPMITEEEYDLLQTIMSGRSRPRKEKHDFPLTGLIKCGSCGMMITAESHTKTYKNGKSQTFIYYRCTKKSKKSCKEPYVPASQLEKQAIDLLGEIKISKKFSDWAVKWLNEANKEHKDIRKKQVKILQKHYNFVQRKLENLLELKISPKNMGGDLLSDEEFREKKNKLVQEKHDIADSLKKTDRQTNIWINLTAKTFDFAATAQERFEKGTPEEKKTILRAVGSNLMLEDKKLNIQPRTPFILIKKALSDAKATSKTLEPNELPVFLGKNGGMYPQNIAWGD